MRSELLQRWITIRGASSITVVAQDAEDWLDTAGASDIVAYVDVREFTYTFGINANYFLYLESSPTRDEALFTQVAPPVAISSGSTQSTITLTVRSNQGAASLNPLGRWLRWRLVAVSPSVTWDLTFRIRIHRSRTKFFSPTQLPGCLLWLRSDLGVPSIVTTTFTSSTPGNVWGDQSGYGNNCTASSNGCPYVQGTTTSLPYLNPTAASSYLAGSSLSGPGSSSHTLFMVVSVPSSIGALTMYPFAATVSGGKSTAFSMWATSSVIDARATSMPGTGLDISSSLTLGTTSIYTSWLQMTAATTGTMYLYINGTNVAGSAGNLTGFTPGTPNAYTVFAEDSGGDSPFYGATAAAYEFIIFNRALLPAELTVVHRYLGGRYGISVP